ncbi:hypothetical protein B0H14DRAFT_2606123 [Mycena olivaceomarginata]|nr:hypothetical protein B0H14DRAFT_2606123 [Mycena olivaceomarginata]
MPRTPTAPLLPPRAPKPELDACNADTMSLTASAYLSPFLPSTSAIVSLWAQSTSGANFLLKPAPPSMATISLYTTAPSLAQAGEILDTHINIMPFSPGLVRLNCALRQPNPTLPPTASLVSSDQVVSDPVAAFAARAAQIAGHEPSPPPHSTPGPYTSSSTPPPKPSSSSKTPCAPPSSPTSPPHAVPVPAPAAPALRPRARRALRVRQVHAGRARRHPLPLPAWGGTPEKRAYLLDAATKALGLGLDVHALPEAVQAQHVQVQQIEDYTKAHFWAAVLSLELVVCVDVTEAERIRRQVQRVGRGEVEGTEEEKVQKIQELRDKDVVKRERGAECVKGIADVVLDNSGGLEEAWAGLEGFLVARMNAPAADVSGYSIAEQAKEGQVRPRALGLACANAHAATTITADRARHTLQPVVYAAHPAPRMRSIRDRTERPRATSCTSCARYTPASQPAHRNSSRRGREDRAGTAHILRVQAFLPCTSLRRGGRRQRDRHPWPPSPFLFLPTATSVPSHAPLPRGPWRWNAEAKEIFASPRRSSAQLGQAKENQESRGEGEVGGGGQKREEKEGRAPLQARCLASKGASLIRAKPSVRTLCHCHSSEVTARALTRARETTKEKKKRSPFKAGKRARRPRSHARHRLERRARAHHSIEKSTARARQRGKRALTPSSYERATQKRDSALLSSWITTGGGPSTSMGGKGSVAVLASKPPHA